LVGSTASTALPLLDAYLRGLPKGADSFPAFEQKASVFRSFTAGVDVAALVPLVPASVRSLLLTPPPPAMWLPEVHANCVYLAMADRLLGGADGLLRHAKAANRAVMDGPLYRMLLKLISSSRLLKQSLGVWSQMHRGMDLTMELTDAGASFRISHPLGLMPPALVPCYATGFQVGLEVAGLRNVLVNVAATTETHSSFAVSWDVG
jgi:hypothetical protein